MSSKRKILMAAHTTGAAQQLVEVASAIRERHSYDLDIFAQAQAIDVFKAAGIGHITLDQPLATDPASTQVLMNLAPEVLAHQPALILTGYSTVSNGLGIDEFLHSIYNGPTLILQDTPGVLSALPRSNQRYLTTTQAGFEKTRALRSDATGKIEATVIGSPKFGAYAGKDLTDLARQFRNTYSQAAKGRTIVTANTQHLTQFPEYLALWRKFADVAAAAGVFVVHRPSPAEWAHQERFDKGDTNSQPHLARRAEIFDDILPGAWTREERGTPEELSLAGSDIVISYCSQSLVNLVNAAHFAPQTLAAPMAMMWDTALNAKLEVADYPEMQQGRGIMVRDAGDLANLFDHALSDVTRASIHGAAQRMEMPVKDPIERTLQVIRKSLPRLVK